MKAEAAWRSVMAMMANWTGLTHRSMEDAAEANCEALVTRALGVAPEDVSRADEARDVVLGLFNEMEGKEPCELA
jgi:hypothetical protein